MFRRESTWGLRARGVAFALGAIASAGFATGADPPVPSADEIHAAIAGGIEFMVDDQNPDGSWGSATRTKGLNIYAPIPGAHHAFRGAVTALGIAALITADADDLNPRAAASLERAETWLLENLPELRRATPDAIYNVWGHIYGIQALALMHQRHADDPDRQARIMETLNGQIELLQRYESVDGGWGYYDFDVGSKRPAASSTSFVNAAGLVALHRAREIGAQIPEPMVKRAIDSTLRQRFPDGSFAYGEYLKMRPRHPINRPGGSLGRSQACNVALRLWDPDLVDPDMMAKWLDRLVVRNLWLDIGRKRPIPHESWFAVAGYFFYFGHYYAALCIEDLPPEDYDGDRYRGQLAGIIVPLQEADGSWWDYPLYDYHQPYGTAFALMTLQACLPESASEEATSAEPPPAR